VRTCAREELIETVERRVLAETWLTDWVDVGVGDIQVRKNRNALPVL